MTASPSLNLIAYEDLGFCKVGEGGKLVESGAQPAGRMHPS